jgi:hypothetical protein
MKKVIYTVIVILIILFPLEIFAYNDLPNWPVYDMSGRAYNHIIVEEIVSSSPGMEVVVPEHREFVFNSAYIHLRSADGTELPGWPVETVSYLGSTTPKIAVGDIDVSSEGKEVVVVAAYEVDPGHLATRVYLFNNDGALITGWYKEFDNYYDFSYPLVADIDTSYPGDEIILMIKGYLHVWHKDGTYAANWPYKWPSTEKEVANTPAVADIDGDGELEIAVVLRDGNVTIFNPDKTILSGWPQDITDIVAGDLIDPILGDIDRDGSIEIITGEGFCPFRFHIFENDGTAFSRWPMVEINVPTPEETVALADIDPDINGLEIIFTHKRYLTINPAVHVYYLDGNLLDGFPYELADSTYVSGPTVANIDADDEPEVLFFGHFETFPEIYNYPRLYAVNPDGSSVSGFPINFEMLDTVANEPLIYDIDGDNSTNLIINYYTAISATIFVGYGRTLVWDLDIDEKPRLSYWPTFRSHSNMDGFYKESPMEPSNPNNRELSILPETGVNLISYMNSLLLFDII